MYVVLVVVGNGLVVVGNGLVAVTLEKNPVYCSTV